MSQVSTIDMHTRVEISELVTRYCHYADHGEGEKWAELFTLKGIFEIAGWLRLEGREQLRSLPGLIAEKGGGLWRHQVSNLMIDHAGLNQKCARAYCTVLDWGNGGVPVHFYEMTILLRLCKRWHFEQIEARVISHAESLVA